MKMQHKYPALFTITSVFRVFGWVTVIWTAALVIMGAIVTFVNGQYLGGGFFGFLGELLGAVWGSLMLLVFYSIIGGTLAVLYFAAAESIQVLLDIEGNTRSE
jgi:hypothetical protein